MFVLFRHAEIMAASNILAFITNSRRHFHTFTVIPMKMGIQNSSGKLMINYIERL